MLTEKLDNYITMPFALGNPVGCVDQPFVYQPWGTRTLKVKITSGIDLPKLWVRPQRVLPEETALGIYKAYADDNLHFHLTWGGGHEIGPCAKTKDVLSAFESCAPFKAGDTSYLYFNLTHAGAEVPDSALVTLRAFERLEENGRISEQDQAKLTIKLQPPASLPPADQIMRLVPVG